MTAARIGTPERLVRAAQEELIQSQGLLEMQAVAKRAKVSVGLAYHHFGSKAGLIAAVVEAFYHRLEEAAFVGDDVIDLPAMRAGGLAIAVKNARAEVKKEAHYVTPHAGGEGALRDAVEFILKAQGKWKKIVEAYIGERSPTVQ